MVYSTLDIFTSVVSTRTTGTSHKKLVVGATHTTANILAAVLTQLSGYTRSEEARCKNQEKWQVWQVAIAKANELGNIE